MKAFEYEDSRFVLFVSVDDLKLIRDALRAAREVYLDDPSRMKLLGTNKSMKVEALRLADMVTEIRTTFEDHKKILRVRK